MKNLSIDTKQNAAIKQTLSLEEFIKKYISPTQPEVKDLKFFSFDLRKDIKK